MNVGNLSSPLNKEVSEPDDECLLSELEGSEADLSNITGLSKVLQIDDSLADRVRFLLEDEENSLQGKKPALLENCSYRSNTEARKLLQDMQAASHPANIKSDNSLQTQHALDESDKILRKQTPVIESQESVDDILNLSDSTEYSELPKVIENRIENSAIQSPNKEKCSSTDTTFRNTNRQALTLDSPVAISGEARFYVESDPNTPHCSNESEKLLHLEKYITKTVDTYSDDQSGSSCTGENNQVSLAPFHSTPFPDVDSKNQGHLEDEMMIPENSKEFVQSGKESITSPRSFDEKNFSIRSEEGNLTSASFDIKPPTEDHASLKDENVLERVNKAVAEQELPSSSELKSRLTVSEVSMGSTVDSLAIQVKNLLSEEERMKQGMSSSSVRECNSHNATQISNFSEEISNFEKTSLWKYAQQFMPNDGLSHPNVRELTTKPAAQEELLHISKGSGDSFNPLEVKKDLHGSMRTYETSLRPQNDTLPKQKRSEFQKRFRLDQTPTVAKESFTSYKSDMKNEVVPSPACKSRIIGRYDRYPTSNSTDLAELQNERFETLIPESSPLSYSPSSFVTPHRRIPGASNGSTSTRWKNTNPKQFQSNPTNSRANGTRINTVPVTHDPYSNSKTLDDLSYLKKRAKHSDTQSQFTAFEKSPLDPKKDSYQSLVQKTKPFLYTKPAEQITQTPIDSKFELLQTNPKSVRFKDETPVNTEAGDMNSSYVSSRNLSTTPKYSFTTPSISCRTRLPTRIKTNTERRTPEVVKSLPTYDQLIAEQEETEAKQNSSKADKDKSDKPDMDQPSKSKAKTALSLNSGLFESNRTELKPEVCDEDADVSSRNVNYDHFTHYPRESNISTSDTELHRRTTSPFDFPHRTKSAGHNSVHGSFKSQKAAEKSVLNGKNRESSAVQTENMTSTRDATTSPVFLQEEPEPPVLPYVCLNKQTPSRNPISTVKVQNFLLKEKSVGMQPPECKDAGRSGAPTPAKPDSGSEELVSLLEYFSEKAPIMENLLRKLHEKSLLKMDEQQQHGGTLTNFKDKSVQTVSSPNPRVLKSVSTNIPLHCKPEEHFVDTSSQTSFSVMESNNRMTTEVSNRDNAIAKQRHQKKPAVILADKNTSTSVKDMKANTKEDKENRVQNKKPCAFFIDVSPQKLEKHEENEMKNRRPVAWFEPFEYIPLWRREESEKSHQMGFVDVDIQDAFLNHKRSFVLRSWERQEDIVIRAEERKLKELERKMHEQIAALHRERSDITKQQLREYNGLDTDPTSMKKRERTGRQLAWKEIKNASKQKYENLPEVIARKRDAERQKYYEANRKRALYYKKKLTRLAVKRQRMKENTKMKG